MKRLSFFLQAAGFISLCLVYIDEAIFFSIAAICFAAALAIEKRNR